MGYTAVWLLRPKLREAMNDADAALLFGFATADETRVPFRSGNSERPSRGRSAHGRLLIANAVEIKPRGNRACQATENRDYSGPTLRGFVADAAVPSVGIRADG